MLDIHCAGPLISKVLSDMKTKQNTSVTSPNLFLYSAHDVTITTQLQALDLDNGLQPPFASALVYELHLVHGDYFVQVRDGVVV